MIQDIVPHHFDNAYRPEPPEKNSIVLCYKDRSCFLRWTEEGIVFPTFEEMEGTGIKPYDSWTYLFSIDEESYYLIPEQITEDLIIKDDGTVNYYSFEEINIFRFVDPQYRAFAGITGFQLHNWYRNHGFCGHCGKKMRPHEKERMMYCDSCGTMEYPKITPAVIIAVTDGNRILLSKYAGRAFRKYALLAGYTEIGETAEETVRREVMEEVGLRVKNIRYYKSQPWSFTETLLMGFFCDLDGEDAITLDEDELALAEWFEREKIPVEPSRDSLTNEMIITFKQGKI